MAGPSTHRIQPSNALTASMDACKQLCACPPLMDAGCEFGNYLLTRTARRSQTSDLLVRQSP